MSPDRVKVRLQRPWPFVTAADHLQSTAPRGCGALLDMQPWPKPIDPPQSWHGSKGMRMRGPKCRVTTCERN